MRGFNKFCDFALFFILTLFFSINQKQNLAKIWGAVAHPSLIPPVSTGLPQMSVHIKYFENGGKNMSFVIKDDDVLDKYNEIWDKIKNTLSVKFHSMPFYDEQHIKAKVREFNGVTKTNVLGNEIPKESTHYTCIACITIDSVMRMEKRIIRRFI